MRLTCALIYVFSRLIKSVIGVGGIKRARKLCQTNCVTAAPPAVAVALQGGQARENLKTNARIRIAAPEPVMIPVMGPAKRPGLREEP